MAEITAALVKELREKTGAGMMDCKKALAETAGDTEAAVDWLRKKGLAAAAKKSGRVAAEGLVGVAANGVVGAAIELNAETDFVARNDAFQGAVTTVAKLAVESNGDIESLKATAYPGTGRTVAEELTHLVATIGENMNLRRIAKLEVKDGIVASYVHSALVPGLGKIGVLVALESTGDKAKLADLGKQIAMHVAAARPEALDIADVSTANLDRERAVLVEQARASGKPENIIEKMVEGRIRKYYEEVVLLEQLYVIDGETKIRKVVEAAAKDVGAPVTLTGFVRFQLGEGIEKEATDFAAEVASMAR
ncbi:MULTISPECIES: translation elongation factor Ts [unclassified Azospirillum]|jgi:elongation factor Ts|uniref:translation elongation factor Ts n=1 Tax=unclassified Azospirillum TaxID=2630922 RepID=UPI000B71C876|nr:MULTISPECIES: translation elongation factor Ts [unclassified Azospirillum]SNS99121.1 translation elongation factor Ts (EF-Ts) [Azospirillum sp. RU38E]SNT15385.1 translation elongation factor Ts (EF-Ts) [Azospirillum sp. RU37A]